MNRKKTTLISLGISMALIALGILFLYTNHMSDWYGSGGWHMEIGSMMGGALILVKILFWIVLLSGLVLMLLGFLAKAAGLPDSSPEDDDLDFPSQNQRSSEMGPEVPSTSSQPVSNTQPNCELELTIK